MAIKVSHILLGLSCVSFFLVQCDNTKTVDIFIKKPNIQIINFKNGQIQLAALINDSILLAVPCVKLKTGGIWSNISCAESNGLSAHSDTLKEVQIGEYSVLKILSALDSFNEIKSFYIRARKRSDSNINEQNTNSLLFFGQVDNSEINQGILDIGKVRFNGFAIGNRNFIGTIYSCFTALIHLGDFIENNDKDCSITFVIYKANRSHKFTFMTSSLYLYQVQQIIKDLIYNNAQVK